MSHGYPVVASKRIYRKWLAKEQRGHEERLHNVRPNIDNKPPRTYDHLKFNAKRDRMMEERYTQIERDNRRLLTKMNHIMSQKNTLDNYNTAAARPHRSLNTHSRTKEMQRIMEENQRLLHRIQSQKPFYNHKEWERQAKEHDRHVQNLREFQPDVEATGAAVRRRTRIKGSRSAGNVAAVAAQRRRGGTASRHEATERLIMKEGRKINQNKYVIFTVIETQHPHALSFRTYDLDSHAAERMDVSWNDVATLVGPTLLEEERREDLASYMCSYLEFEPFRLRIDELQESTAATAVAAPVTGTE